MQYIINSFKSLIFLILISTTIYCYSNDKIDVLYLKNGSVIRGEILELIPNSTVKIQTKDKNIFVFQMSDVDKITKETNEVVEKVEDINNFKKSGYILLSHLNYNSGLENSLDEFGFKIVNGFQFSEHFIIGIGIGIESIKSPRGVKYPVTLESRYTFLTGRTSPTFNLILGTAPEFNKQSRTHYFVNPSLGLKVYLSNNMAFLFDFGAKLQATSWIYAPNTNYEKLIYNQGVDAFLTFNAGFSF